DRYGPADLSRPPPGGPWKPLQVGGRLVGWAPDGGRTAARKAAELGERLAEERRQHLLSRLGHKLRSAVLALQESARQAAFGRTQALELVYEQAQEVGRRAAALEAAAIPPKDPARAVVLAAVLNVAARSVDHDLPGDAIVLAPEPVLVEALARLYDWMGGSGTVFRAKRDGDWWVLRVTPGPDRRALAVPELGEPLVRLLVDTHLSGFLDAADPDRPAVYLPAT
ncbi:MAG TPA: hypothetical protein VK131_11095, partial [Candidatus Acidoferrales bacterium]|nr:hypothetical protein [Candidatus Acidoferrales bacterium]